TYSPSSPGPIWWIWKVILPVCSLYVSRCFCELKSGAPFLVHDIVGCGLPTTLPSNVATPPWAKRAL
ncbi:unnamed protein product, partial [Callosobruchus maculatus]